MRRFAIMLLAAVVAAAAAAMIAVTAANAAPLKGGDVFAPGSGIRAPVGKPAGNASPAATPAGGTYAPLTASECRTLGGSVVNASFCNSGSSCQRTDQNGTVHEVCVSR